MKEITVQVYRQRILRALVFIQKHLDEDLGLDGLARVAGFSPYHFHRIFRGMVGESVKEHVRRLRLERAAMRLRQGVSTPLIEMALDAGYETHESFCRAFRGMFGKSPSEYRRDSARFPEVPSGVHFIGEKGPDDFRPMEGGEMKVGMKELPTMRVAFMRHTGPYRGCGKVWEELMAWAGHEGLLGPDTKFLGLSHDDPDVTPPGKLRYDACVTVDGAFEPVGEVGIQAIPGGEFAVTTHIGPHSGLGATYARLFGQGIPSLGREPASAPCIEFYLNDPESTQP